MGKKKKKKIVPSPVFVLSHKTNYTHMYEFLWSTAAIAASDKNGAKVWEPSDASNTPTLSYKKAVCTHTHTDLHTQASAAVLHIKGAHAHTQISAMLFVSAN